MARRRRRSLLVPEARAVLDQLRDSVIQSEQPSGEPNHGLAGVAKKLDVPYNQNGNNREMKSADAGAIGGVIGGHMVKRLIDVAREEMAREASIQK